MASIKGYRSPCNPKRFRVLAEKKPEGKFFVCEGLAKPVRKAHWRLVSTAATFYAARWAVVDEALGRAILPGDCHDVDFVNAAGAIL